MSKKSILTFRDDTFGDVRGFMKDGEPWFLAGNVCRALGIKNTARAVADVERRYNVAGVKAIRSTYTLLDTPGGKQRVLIIPEPFLYELVFNSRKQKAVKFRTWITMEVIPQLRKQGYYRAEGKIARLAETDAIKQFVDYAESQGSTKPDMYYMHFTRMTNQLLNINAGQRDALPTEKLKDLAILESVIERQIQKTLAEGGDYKNCFQAIKGRVKAFREILG